MQVRKDEYKIKIDKNIYFNVFHKKLDIGFGPAVSLYIHNIEFLKFDCFGKNLGHYHIFNGINNERIYFSEITVEEQINKILFELTNNINTFLLSSNNKKIKSLILPNDFNLKIIAIKNKMLEYENNYYAHLRN